MNTNDQAIDAWFDRITQKLTDDQKKLTSNVSLTKRSNLSG
ncbi:hypothetical protein [Psychrobacter sp. JCM 18901]